MYSLHLTHPKWTHTRSSGQPCYMAPGSSWGFGALLKDTSVVVLKEERALVIHSPTNNPCRTRDSNPQPLDYESDSLTIRPRLPHCHCRIFNFLLLGCFCSMFWVFVHVFYEASPNQLCCIWLNLGREYIPVHFSCPPWMSSAFFFSQNVPNCWFGH